MTIIEGISMFTTWKSFNVKPTTICGYSLILRQFALFLRNCEIEKIKLTDIIEWFDLMQQMNWDKNSFIPKAMALRKFFEFFKKQGYPVIDPWLIPLPNKQYKIPRIIDDEKYQKLLKIIPENNDPRHIRNKAIINLLWDTGARNGEICSLNIDDLDLINKKALIKTEKSKGMRPIREIFWTEETNKNILKWLEKREFLENKMEIHDKEALFISVCNQASGKRFNIKGVGEMLRRYCNRAKIPYMNAHSFRHHMGHNIVHKGGNNSDISNILGHSSLQSSFIYTQMNNVELEKRYRVFVGQ